MVFRQILQEYSFALENNGVAGVMRCTSQIPFQERTACPAARSMLSALRHQRLRDLLQNLSRCRTLLGTLTEQHDNTKAFLARAYLLSWAVLPLGFPMRLKEVFSDLCREYRGHLSQFCFCPVFFHKCDFSFFNQLSSTSGRTQLTPVRMSILSGKGNDRRRDSGRQM